MIKNLNEFYFVFIFFISCGMKKDNLTCSEILTKYEYLKANSSNTLFSDSVYGLLKEVERKDSGCIYVNVLLGDIYASNKKYPEAIKEYRLAIKKENSNVYAVYNLGKMYFNLNNYDSAISCFRFALKLKGGNGFVLEKTDGYNKIIEAPNLDVKYKEIIFSNALASFYGEYYIDSNNEFKYCVANNIQLSESYYFLGLIYLKINEYKDACKFFQLAKENGNLKTDSVIDKYCKNINSM